MFLQEGEDGFGAGGVCLLLVMLCLSAFRWGAVASMALLVFYKPDDPDWGGVMAASTVMTIPVLVFFVLVQRRLVSGLGGAVKD